FTFKNVGFVVQAICDYLKDNNLMGNGIFIGYDNRFLSEDFAAHAAKILSSNKIKVYLAETSVPTPLTAFMAVDLKLDGSIMITASHNPSKYNGIKFIPYYGGPADDKITKAIEKKLSMILDSLSDCSPEKSDKGNKILNKEVNAEYNTDTNNIEVVSDFKNYKDKLISNINAELIKDVKPGVAVDTMFGAGSKIFPEIINEELHLNAEIFNNYRDPLFGSKLPDPSEKNLAALKDYVLENKLDAGIALDGDADRFGVIDGKGIYISPNNVIAMMLYYLIESKRYKKDDTAVRTVATTHLIDEICNDNNLDLIETPVGFKHIAKIMLERNVLIGGEESGGLTIKGHIPEKDGLLAGLILIEIQSHLKRKYGFMSLSDYLEKIYKKYGKYYNRRIDIEIPSERKADVINYFINLKDNLKARKIQNIKVTDVSDRDGAKVIFEDKSWLLVRASGTEPLIRCYIESKNSDFFFTLLEFTEDTINSLSQ
ncbi:MAG: phosphoglucomutase/phosphomannomutase family protein, partial [Actinobacteria bacterium]|nr:phosphoglucomutase/phosphomannomutase family protein [Actinomycetota bacterium]